MQKRERILAEKENRKPKKLSDSDYLLGVYDMARMGGIRLKLEEDISSKLGISKSDAEKYKDFISNIVKDNWERLASKYGIERSEIEKMRPAFSECYKNE